MKLQVEESVVPKTREIRGGAPGGEKGTNGGNTVEPYEECKPL